jgi:integrase
VCTDSVVKDLATSGTERPGQPRPSSAYVFGTAIGTRVKSIKRAWHTAILKAHGHTPTYSTTANLTAESWATFEAIDLHFHDLRREAGSRWLEGGVPLHTIRDWLGHTSIAQTSTYLAGTMQTQHDAMRRYDERRAAAEAEAEKARVARRGTDSKRRGRKAPQTAGRAERNANKTTVDRHQPIM